MSIKFDWDVSAAPTDDLAPLISANRRDLSDRHSRAGERGSRTQPNARGAGRRRWVFGAFLLAAVAGGGLWFFTQAGWQKVSSEVAAAATYEDQQAAQGAANLLLNIQDRGNVDWLTVRRDEALARQPAPLPMPVLNFGQAPLRVAGVTALDTDFMLADVSRQFTAPDGQTLAFTLPQFYRRGAGGDWLRSAPPGDFWGNWLDWQGARLVIRYSERDADFVRQVAPVLEKRLADACAVWADGCASPAPVRLYLSGFVGSLEYNPISNIEVRIELGVANSSSVTPAEYFLSIPSPQLAGLPTDAAGRNYLADYLAVRLIASLARHVSTSPETYFERTTQAIQALGLTSADPGYLASGQRRRAPPTGGALLFAQGDNGPSRRQDRLAWRVVYYTTAPGDTLPSVAAHFNTSVFAIERANRLGNPDFLPAGVKLTIPLFSPVASSP